MINRETDYAIRAVLCLSRTGGTGSASTAEVARTMEIPYRFLRKLVRPLVRSGVVRSRRGKGGGLTLVRRPEAISLLDVVQAFAPAATKLSLCVDGRSRCGRMGHCAVHRELKEVQRVVDERLGQITFAALAAEPAVGAEKKSKIRCKDTK
jgi:Rrf2 family protein